MSSDHILSQEEIDALLRSAGSERTRQDEPPAAARAEPAAALLPVDQDALAEALRIAWEAALQGVEGLTATTADLPEPAAATAPELAAALDEGALGLRFELRGEIEGSGFWVLPPAPAGDPAAPESEAAGDSGLPAGLDAVWPRFGEALSAVLGADLAVEAESALLPAVELAQAGEEKWLRLAVGVQSGEEAAAAWWCVLPAPVAEQMMALLSRQAQEAQAAAAEPPAEEAAVQPVRPPAVEGGKKPLAPPRSIVGPARAASAPVSVQPAGFGEVHAEGGRREGIGNIDLILDVPLSVTVELGRSRMQIKDVLELAKGVVIELDKLAGEPVDVFVNGKLIAKGEVVVIDENFGVKITDIVSPLERVRSLQ